MAKASSKIVSENKRDFKTLMKNMQDDIEDNYELNIMNSSLYKSLSNNDDISPLWPDSIKTFYSQLNGVITHWIHSDNKNDPSITGHVKLLSAKDVGSIGRDIIWFDHTPTNDPLRLFKIIDFFMDEAAVGFYENGDEEMYLYQFEGSPAPLGVNFEGYIRLLCEAKGFFYWQQVLLALKTKKENLESKNFKTYMPQIFPDFRYDDFVKLYEEVKIIK